MNITYTKHAIANIKLRNIEKSTVEALFIHPQQTMKLEGGAEIAQGIFVRDKRKFLLRVVFKKEENGDNIKVITAYWTTKIEKYWEGEL